ncbi:MAG: ABC transporter substrate-binding protein [Verrucomicrobiaceae bacterium]
MLKRTAVPFCALLLMLGVFLLPHGEIKPRMKVALSVWPGSEAVVLARDASLLPEGRTRVIELPWASAVTRTFDDEVVDVAVLTLDVVLQLRESGQHLRVLQVLDESTGGDAVIAQEPIKDLHDLKGKRVGVDLFGSGMYLLINALEHAGMKLDDIQTVPLIQPEIESMFDEGNIDAAVAAEPWLTQVSSLHTHRLYDSKELKTPIFRLLVASEHACQEYQKELPTLLAAMTKMNRLVRSGTQFEGMAVILRRERVSFEDFVRSLDHWRPLDAKENAALLEGSQPALNMHAQRMGEQMVRNGLLGGLPADTEWLDPRFLKHAWE